MSPKSRSCPLGPCRLNRLLPGELTHLLLLQGSTMAAQRTKTSEAPATVELSSEGLLGIKASLRLSKHLIDLQHRWMRLIFRI